MGVVPHSGNSSGLWTKRSECQGCCLGNSFHLVRLSCAVSSLELDAGKRPRQGSAHWPCPQLYLLIF